MVESTLESSPTQRATTEQPVAFISVEQLLQQPVDQALNLAVEEIGRLKAHNQRLEELVGLDTISRIRSGHDVVFAMLGMWNWPVIGTGIRTRLRALIHLTQPSEPKAA